MILVSILGDFHSSILPIFFEFKDKIKTHILIYDDSKYDQEQFNKIMKGQNYFLRYVKDLRNDIKINFNLLPLKIEEDSFSSIINTYHKIVKHSKTPKDIFINTTDGLSSVSIVLGNKFLNYGANIISYDRYANTYNLHTKNSMKRCEIKYNIDIKNHLKLIGYNILSYTNKFELRNRKDTILELTKDLEKYKEFVDLLQNNFINNIKGFKKYKKLLLDINKINDRPFIQGTVFEEYIYHLLKDNFDFDDIMTSVSIEFNLDFLNELDILMIKDNHLHTIECKFVNNLDGEHYVYKTNSIIDYLDDDGKAMILSIGGENERVTKSGNKKFQFSQGTKARAKNGNIKIHQNKVFDKDEFLKDVKQWFCAK